MVFKFVGDVTPEAAYDLWSSANTLLENDTAALNTNSTHSGHYKNRIVHTWQTFNPLEVCNLTYLDNS